MKSDLGELGLGALKITPPVAVASAAQVGKLDPQSLLIYLSIVYTVFLIAKILIDNGPKWWGMLRKAWLYAFGGKDGE